MNTKKAKEKSTTSESHTQVPKVQTAEGWRRAQLREHDKKQHPLKLKGA